METKCPQNNPPLLFLKDVFAGCGPRIGSPFLGYVLHNDPYRFTRVTSTPGNRSSFYWFINAKIVMKPTFWDQAWPPSSEHTMTNVTVTKLVRFLLIKLLFLICMLLIEWQYFKSWSFSYRLSKKEQLNMSLFIGESPRSLSNIGMNSVRLQKDIKLHPNK